MELRFFFLHFHGYRPSTISQSKDPIQKPEHVYVHKSWFFHFRSEISRVHQMVWKWCRVLNNNQQNNVFNWKHHERNSTREKMHFECKRAQTRASAHHAYRAHQTLMTFEHIENMYIVHIYYVCECSLVVRLRWLPMRELFSWKSINNFQIEDRKELL